MPFASASATTWGKQLSALEARASDHETFAGQLITQVVEPLKHSAGRYEELRKFHAEFAARLEKERDSTYSDLKKVKAKYDASCQELESRRKKADGSIDHGKSKVHLNYIQQLNDMNNVKVCKLCCVDNLLTQLSRILILSILTPRIDIKSYTTTTIFLIFLM